MKKNLFFLIIIFPLTILICWGIIYYYNCDYTIDTLVNKSPSVENLLEFKEENRKRMQDSGIVGVEIVFSKDQSFALVFDETTQKELFYLKNDDIQYIILAEKDKTIIGYMNKQKIAATTVEENNHGDTLQKLMKTFGRVQFEIQNENGQYIKELSNEIKLILSVKNDIPTKLEINSHTKNYTVKFLYDTVKYDFLNTLLLDAKPLDAISQRTIHSMYKLIKNTLTSNSFFKIISDKKFVSYIVKLLS